MSRLALIAGRGALPAALIATLADRPLICALDGFAPDVPTDITFRLERLVPFLRALQDAGVTEVAFAGAVRRPRLDPALFDPATAQLVPRLLAAMQAGDDATLREFVALFEEADLTVRGIADIAPALLPGAGVIAGAITLRDQADATRAAEIVAALGAVDVGQGACVAQGQCLAVEALPGTDAMLIALADLPATLRPDPRQGKGVFYKAAKPGQDRRIDLPTLGPETIRHAAAAGLGGVAFQAGSVICLNLPEMLAQAARLDVFLWSRP
ncbi:MAG: UDP-2,3-diacylglucosamine diphosphatase LpxI [Paracoccaceae bacterium]